MRTGAALSPTGRAVAKPCCTVTVMIMTKAANGASEPTIATALRAHGWSARSSQPSMPFRLRTTTTTHSAAVTASTPRTTLVTGENMPLL